MKTTVVLPFLTLKKGNEAVQAGDWYFMDPAVSRFDLVDPSHGISGWSYYMPLNFSRKFEISGELLRSALSLEEREPEYELILSVRIGSLGQRKVVKRTKIQHNEDFAGSLEFSINSEEVCEEITLVSTLILSQDVSDSEPWAPCKRGCRLWDDESRIQIEGTGGRFPMRDVNFSEDYKLPSEADWHIEWQPNLLHYSFNSAVSLLVNSEKVDFLQRLKERDEITVRQVMAGVICEIGTYLICHEGFLDPDESFQEGSLGAIVKTWIELAYPGSTVESVRAKYLMTPNAVLTNLRSIAARL